MRRSRSRSPPRRQQRPRRNRSKAPPKKPENLRVDHFGSIDVPCLFVSGDRDEFGSPEEFDEHLGAINAPVTVVRLPGKRHDLKGVDGAVCDAVASWLGGLTA